MFMAYCINIMIFWLLSSCKLQSYRFPSQTQIIDKKSRLKTENIIFKKYNIDSIRGRWHNGSARWQQWPCYLHEPGFESHLWPVEFFTCNKVSPLNNWIPTLTFVPQISSLRLSKVVCKTSKQKRLHYTYSIESVCICYGNMQKRKTKRL